jgi:crotonobetainyl-CoA:carnitine CoA-transferase CaiB-like acyl-CoA transferase
MTTQTPLPLAGVTVLEIGGGAAGAYCGRLLADAGARVTTLAIRGNDRHAGVVRADDPAEHAYGAWLDAGKRVLPATDATALSTMAAGVDLVIVGEAAPLEASLLVPRRARVALSWFGRAGPWRDWQGSDLAIEALTGLPQMAGPRDGPPIHAGDRHATTIAGVTAYIALVSSLAAKAPATRQFEVSILEANLALSEMHMHFFERDGLPMRRCGLNRFHPNSPVGVYPCKDGWVGITATTPEQWQSLCVALGMQAQGADPQLATRELRFERLDEVEAAMVHALAAKPANEWAALGRRHKVPIVVVPDAPGILAHPVFAERGALAGFTHDGRALQVPRTPFSLTATPVRRQLDDDGADATDAGGSPSELTATHAPPLAGLTVVDFAMGWAGPLASRLLADLGADVIKVEAGRYPDWWRGVNWTAEYIEQRLYEDAKGFCALNRGKRGVSLDLTTDTGRALALTLIAGADAVVENQAAGVMGKLGLGYEALAAVNPDIVMLSMSAFGTGNAWSDTRAYGSTLEQGAGLPSFMGFPEHPPTMVQLAYGDPVGGLFGCAAAVTALAHRARGGRGQYVNLSMVEAMLQFAAQPLLRHQVASSAPLRRGNRHAVHAPHGIYPAQGTDQWIALALTDEAAFARLGALIGRPEWAKDAALASAAGRKAREDQLDAAITAWSQRTDRDDAVRALQAAGVSAAPVLHAEELFELAHLEASGFYLDLTREFSGPQRQAGIAIVQDGRRLGARRPAPLMGEHSREVLQARAGVDDAGFEALVAQDIVTFAPKSLRATILPSTAGGGA